MPPGPGASTGDRLYEMEHAFADNSRATLAAYQRMLDQHYGTQR
jgi:hypothetical protein